MRDKRIEEEIRQVQETGLRCYKYVFISRSGFEAEEREGVEYIALEELFTPQDTK